MGCVLCARVKENGPTAKMRPYGRVFAIGVRGEGWEMTPDTKNTCFSCWESVPGLPNMKMCPQGHDFVLGTGVGWRGAPTRKPCPPGHDIVLGCIRAHRTCPGGQVLMCGCREGVERPPNMKNMRYGMCFSCLDVGMG